MRVRALVLAFFLPLTFFFFVPPAFGEKTPYDWAFIHLDYTCREKVEQLKRFTDRVHQMAGMAAEDTTVAAFFEMNRAFYKASHEGDVPASLATDIAKMREHFNGYYIQNYITFYDILFINLDGEVFYSLRKEADYQEKLFDKGTKLTQLGTSISSNPDRELFVDFHEYGPSAEPAAFFVKPVYQDGQQVGWIALQLAINKLNAIFSSTEDLGQTGETFLVNKDGLMLTESYFTSHSTILKVRLDDRNINAKFHQGRGRLVVTDYRGVQALSSFEVVEFMGTRWLVVAKEDQDEIITEHYLRHKRYYAEAIIEQLGRAVAPPPLSTAPSKYSAALRVDMDEFMKADNGDLLETWGLATCTALLVALPDRFAYLAHISSKDRAYGGQETNLVGQMTKKMQGFDIYPSEKHQVIFVVIAPVLDSLTAIVDQILSDGFLLSQINVVYNPDAKSAALVYDYQTHDLTVTWKMKQTGDRSPVHHFQDAFNLGRMVEQILSPIKDNGPAEKKAAP
jgi:hypothetical protein